MRPSFVVLGVTVASLLACTGGDTTITAPAPPTPLAGSGTTDSPHVADCWTTDKDLKRTVGQTDVISCPAGCTTGMIWGTGRYTPDSKLCVAAVHAGVLPNAGSGTVLVRIEGSSSNFQGSIANGIESYSWSSSVDTTFSVSAPREGGRKAGKGGDDGGGGKAGKGGKGGKAH